MALCLDLAYFETDLFPRFSPDPRLFGPSFFQNTVTMPAAVAATRKSRSDLEEHMASMGITMRSRSARAAADGMSDDEDAEASSTRGRSKSARGAKKRSFDSSVGPAEKRCVWVWCARVARLLLAVVYVLIARVVGADVTNCLLGGLLSCV